MVLAISANPTSLAVSAFRGESPVQKMNNAALGFESWCAQVRYSAMENGTDRIVAFHPEERIFLAVDPEAAQSELAWPSQEEERPPLQWKLPDEFELDSDTLSAEAGEDGSIEVFRFFSDGGANAAREFVLKFRNFERRFQISPLTGLLRQSEGETDAP